MDRHPPLAISRPADVPDLATTLVDEHYDYVVRLAQSILGDADEAEDAAQETLLAALKAFAQYRGQAALRTWLYRIAVNACRGRLRKRRLRRLLTGQWQQQRASLTSEAAEQVAARVEADRQLWAAVEALDDKHRLPLLLRHLDNLTAPEIGQILGISEGTVYSRLHHARRKLRRRLSHAEQPLNQKPEALP